MLRALYFLPEAKETGLQFTFNLNCRSLLASREPTTPIPYWRATLVVFNAGENLPVRRGPPIPHTDFWE